MPQIGFHHLGQGKLSPGDTVHWWWNNAGRQKVWAFSADAEVQLMFAFSGAVAKLEITKSSIARTSTARARTTPSRRSISG